MKFGVFFLVWEIGGKDGRGFNGMVLGLDGLGPIGCFTLSYSTFYYFSVIEV